MGLFEGRGNSDQLEKDHTCPKCKKAGQVYYVGSSVTHGNPFTPAADTEVEHYFECRNCDHEWTRYV